MAMQLPFSPRWVRALLCGLAVVSAAPAQAQLQALVLERSTQQSFLADLQASNASLSAIAGSLPAISLAPTAVANNPLTQQVFVLGPASDGNLQLIRFNADGSGAQIVGNSGNPARALAFHFELSSQRLIALLQQSGQLVLASVDPNSAALTTIHSGNSDCCVLSGGGSALLNGQFFVTGRLRSDAATTQRLLSFSTSGDNALSTPLLSVALGALALNPNDNQLYGLGLSSGPLPASPNLQLVRVASDGSSVGLGSAGAGCCALDFDVATVSAGQLIALTHPAGGGTQILSADLGTGVFSFSSAPLASGTVINALYDLSMGLISTSTNITSVLPNPVAIGQNYSVSASVTAAMGSPTGTVLISDELGNSCSFAAPSGACALPATALGTRTITASYQSNGSFVGSSANTTVQVNPTATTTQISAINPSPSTVGNNYTVNVAVSGFNPSGMVNVSDGLGMSCVITLPATSCALSATTAGNRTITAQYSGDANNLPSMVSVTHTVSAAASTINLGPVSPEPSNLGQSYTVNATVSGFGTPGGTVTISDGQGASCVITLPASNCLLSNNTAGTLTLSAQYSGDTNNLPSTASLAHNVNRAPSTTQILSISPTPVRAGTPYTVTVQVSGFGSPGGSVVVDDGHGISCTINLPANSCALTSMLAGMTTISANYSGDINNLPSLGSMALAIQPSFTSVSMVVTPNPPVQSQPVILEAILSDAVEAPLRGVGGTISFRRNGVLIPGCEALSLVNGSALCSTQFDQAMAILLRADYSGDANNEPSFVELGIIVDALPIPTLSSGGLLGLILLLAALAWRQLPRARSAHGGER